MVIAGDSRGQQGKVLRVDAGEYKAIVEGVNLVSKHTKPNAKSPQGGIIKKEAPFICQISRLLTTPANPHASAEGSIPKPINWYVIQKNQGRL